MKLTFPLHLILPVVVAVSLAGCDDPSARSEEQAARERFADEVARYRSSLPSPPVTTATTTPEAAAAFVNRAIPVANFSAGDAKNDPVQGTEDAVLTDAPKVPPPITRTHATKVKVKLEVQEIVKRMS